VAFHSALCLQPIGLHPRLAASEELGTLLSTDMGDADLLTTSAANNDDAAANLPPPTLTLSRTSILGAPATSEERGTLLSTGTRATTSSPTASTATSDIFVLAVLLACYNPWCLVYTLLLPLGSAGFPNKTARYVHRVA